eukprot:TRINITY_DN1510_c0_g3_i1.p1 TRINITY_DN1510_c0_g3~~TRINITY_DN1510_c0_g3_i1.p1  ORF type:complete len:634 (-),score=72.65 TRINITY_DN1510_c0_g3_i1:206-1969(-)
MDEQIEQHVNAQVRPALALKRTSSICLPTPTELVFHDVGLSVPIRKSGEHGASKKILSGVSGGVYGGRMFAVVGGSGAGKTTLLDILTLQGRKRSSMQGVITLNGKPLTEERFLQCAAYVQQESLLWGTLTTRETLEYGAKLYGAGPTAQERADMVEDVLVQTGLMSCADTLVGDLLYKGLSGGQKKRLCLAEALVKRPAMIILDEPTSALDSSSVVEVMRVLQNLARTNNILVLCTIHQPSQRIFNLFDDVLVLAQGRVAYVGPTCEAKEYMQGSNVPPMGDGVSLCEYLLDLTNPDFTHQAQVTRILDSWSEASAPDRIEHACGQSPEVQARPLAVQVAIIVRRLALMATRDPMMFGARWIATAISSAFFAAIYIAARQMVQDQVLQRLQLLNWVLGAPAFMAVVVIAIASSDFLIYKKEVNNGMYTPLASALGHVIVAVPAAFVLSCCALLPVYGLVGYYWAAFPKVLLAHTLAMIWADSLGQLLAVLFPHYLLSMAAYIMTMFVCFLMNGVIISLKFVPMQFSWLAYLNPWMYCLRTMIRSEFVLSTFDGFGDHGEECRGLCWGRSGAQVLDNVGRMLYSSVS